MAATASPTKGKGAKKAPAVYNTWQELIDLVSDAGYAWPPMHSEPIDLFTGPFYEEVAGGEAKPIVPMPWGVAALPVTPRMMAELPMKMLRYFFLHPMRGINFNSDKLWNLVKIEEVFRVPYTPEMSGKPSNGWTPISLATKKPYTQLGLLATKLYITTNPEMGKVSVHMSFMAIRSSFSSNEKANEAFTTYLLLYSVDSLATFLKMTPDKVVMIKPGYLVTNDGETHDLPLPTGTTIRPEDVASVLINGGDIFSQENIRMNDEDSTVSFRPLCFSLDLERAAFPDLEGWQEGEESFTDIMDLGGLIAIATGQHGILDHSPMESPETYPVVGTALDMVGNFIVSLNRISINSGMKKAEKGRTTTVSMKYYDLLFGSVTEPPTIGEKPAGITVVSEPITKASSAAAVANASALF